MEKLTVGLAFDALSGSWSGPEGSSQLGVFSAIESLRGAKCAGSANNGTSRHPCLE
ncbi:MAG: hypothetical protein ACXAD7_28975 [Candidatus Kariarchaeaceae archaeon]